MYYIISLNALMFLAICVIPISLVRDNQPFMFTMVNIIIVIFQSYFAIKVDMDSYLYKFYLVTKPILPAFIKIDYLSTAILNLQLELELSMLGIDEVIDTNMQFMMLMNNLPSIYQELKRLNDPSTFKSIVKELISLLEECYVISNTHVAKRSTVHDLVADPKFNTCFDKILDVLGFEKGKI